MRYWVPVSIVIVLLLGALGTEADDLAVLTALKTSLLKSSGTDDWSGPCSLTSCSWPGVTLNNSRVVGLEIYLRTGVVPTSIGLLDALESLTFPGSSVTAPLPLEAYNLRSLTRLSHPVVQGGYTIPPQIGLLTNLVTIDFYQTNLYGTLPTEIGFLTKVKSFGIFGNQVTGVVPTEIGNMKALEFIHLGDNWKLTGPIPSSFWGLSNLTKVIFTATNLIGTLPVELPQLKQLKEFSITYLGGINGSIPTEWGDIGMPNLTTLNLGSTSISGEIPASFYTLTSLVSVSLDSTQITGTISPLIGNLRALQDFTIANTRLLAGTIPTEIGLIDDLVTLHWTNANLTGPLPTQLFKYNLSTIELGGNFLTGTLPTEFAINMKPGRNGYPGNIGLSNNPWTITTFPTEFASLKNLWTLSLTGLDFRGAPLPPEFKDLSTRELDISNCNLTGTLPPLVAISDRLWASGNHFTGTIPSSYAYMQNLDLRNNPLSGTIPPEILLNPNMNLDVRGVAVSNCTLPAGIAPPANASCFDLCVPSPLGCVRASVAVDACVSVCPRVGCALPPPTPDAFCDLGLWHIPGSFIQNGNISISTSPIVVEGNYTANGDAVTVITLSGNAPGVPRINVTESATLEDGTTLVILIDADVDAGTTIDVVVSPSVSGNYSRVVLDGSRAKCVRSTQSTTSAGISVLLTASGCAAHSHLGLILGVVLGVIIGLSVLVVVLLIVFRDRVPFFKHRRRLRGSRRSEGVYDT